MNDNNDGWYGLMEEIVNLNIFNNRSDISLEIVTYLDKHLDSLGL